MMKKFIKVSLFFLLGILALIIAFFYWILYHDSKTYLSCVNNNTVTEKKLFAFDEYNIYRSWDPLNQVFHRKSGISSSNRKYIKSEIFYAPWFAKLGTNYSKHTEVSIDLPDKKSTTLIFILDRETGFYKIDFTEGERLPIEGKCKKISKMRIPKIKVKQKF